MSENTVGTDAIELAGTKRMSGSEQCFACWTCSLECPVNIYTNRLSPSRIVHAFQLGLSEELVRSPELWYCIGCNRCSNVCPMNVKPADILFHLRMEALKRGVLSPGIRRDISILSREFQAVRLEVARSCLSGQPVPDLTGDWEKLTESRAEEGSNLPMVLTDKGNDLGELCKFYGDIPTGVKRCISCRECANACPITFDHDVFAPLIFFRLANLGVYDESILLPGLWLCLECQSCTMACAEGVKGHLVIRLLKEDAFRRVEPRSLELWNQAQKTLFSEFLDRVDSLFQKNHGSHT